MYHFDRDTGTLQIPPPDGIPSDDWQEWFFPDPDRTAWDVFGAYLDKLRARLVDVEAEVTFYQSFKLNDENKRKLVSFLKERLILQKTVGRLQIVWEKRPRPEASLHVLVHESLAHQRNQDKQLAEHQQAIAHLQKSVRGDRDLLSSIQSTLKSAGLAATVTTSSYSHRQQGIIPPDAPDPPPIPDRAIAEKRRIEKRPVIAQWSRPIDPSLVSTFIVDDGRSLHNAVVRPDP